MKIPVKMDVFYRIFLLIPLLLLAGCTTPTRPAKHGTTGDQIEYELHSAIAQDHKNSIPKKQMVPHSVSEALLPPVLTPLSEQPIPSEHRFNITVDKIPAKSFFMGLVEGTSYNMVLDPNVNGTISLKLKNVTIDETLAAVQDAYGFQYHKTEYGYEVLPAQLETRMFNVNYIDVKRTGKSFTQITSGQISEKIGTVSAGSASNILPPTGTTTTGTTEGVSHSSVDTRSEAFFWKDLAETLRTLLGPEPGHSVTVNAQAGVVIIRAFPRELRQVARYLDRIQTSLQRQVILEAKILEVQLNDEFQQGIDWNLFGKKGAAGIQQDGTTKIFEGTDINNFAGFFTLSVAPKSNFSILIKLLQTQGNVQILSNPRISTVNNQKAMIKVGQDEFFVTGVSTSNFISGNSNLQPTPTQDVSLTPFFSGVTLDVTPQISNDGTIILHIHPSISTVKNQQKEIVLGTIGTTPNVLSLPLALSNIRESDNIVRAKNGQIIVIGGLMQNTMQEEVAGTPIISRMPFVGTLFRRTFQRSVKSELVILLRPIIVEQHTWAENILESDKKFHCIKRGYHIGGLPDVFGTEGERPNSDCS